MDRYVVYEFNAGFAPIQVESFPSEISAAKMVSNNKKKWFAVDLETGKGITPFRT